MKDAYYFSHDSNARNDHRIIRLRMNQGNNGYAVYFMIIEILRDVENYQLSLNDISSIAYDIREEEEIIEDVITNYDLFIIEENHFYSNSLKRRMQKLDQIKEKRSFAGKMSGVSRAEAKQKGTSVEQVLNSKVKYSKEKKSKVYNKKALDSFDKFWKLYNKKVSKNNCLKKFNLLSAKDQTDILIALPDYIKSTPDRNFRKNPLTYLNQESWKDEIIKKGSNFDYKSLLSVSHKDIQKYEKN